jgi:hypothetical protein
VGRSRKVLDAEKSCWMGFHFYPVSIDDFAVVAVENDPVVGKMKRRASCRWVECRCGLGK